MAPRTLSLRAASLAALGVISLAVIAATADQVPMDGHRTLALVDPQGEFTYKTAHAEGWGNVKG
jgi:hypothetical protein